MIGPLIGACVCVFLINFVVALFIYFLRLLFTDEIAVDI